MTLAQEYLNRKVSVYRNAHDTKGVDLTLRSVLEDIRDGKLAGPVADVRRLHQALPALPNGLLPDDRKGIAAWKRADPDAHGVWNEASKAYNAAKRKLPAFITAGTFRSGHRHGETPPPAHLKQFPDCPTGLLEHSGLTIEDIDHLAAHGADQELLLAQFADHPAVIGAFVSPSNDGIKVIMAVDPVPWDDESHVRVWAGGRDALASIYPFIDESGKNSSRLCYQSDHRGCYIAPDDKVIVPARMAEPEPVPEPEDPPGGKPKGRPRREPTLDELRDALDFLADQGVGGDDNSLVAVGMCMKSRNHSFQEFDEWAAAAGCSCTNRRARWDTFRDADTDYSAIIGMAVNWGWEGMGKRKRKRTSRTAAAPSAVLGPEGSGSWYRIGYYAGQQLKGVWIYDNRDDAPSWFRFREGVWRQVTTADHKLSDFFAAWRLRIAAELEEAEWQEGGRLLANDHLWNRQKSPRSDFMAGVRAVLGGKVPPPAQYHVGVANGCVHLATGKLHPHSPACGQRALTAGAYLPEELDRLEPVLREYLDKPFDRETQSKYLELVGLSFTGEASSHRALVLIQGKSGSGKGGAIALQRVALGGRATAIKNNWFDKPAGEIDAVGADLLEYQPDSISISEIGVRSMRHRETVLSTIGGEEAFPARRAHGATIYGTLMCLWWTSCVKYPEFPRDTGIERRTCVLETQRKLKPREKNANSLKNKDLLDALVTMAIEQIRRVGFFHPGAAGYVPPGGAEDLATARGLDGMDPLPGWLERLGDEWDERSTDDARLAFMESPGTQGREVSMRVFGDRVNESKRWTKRRAEVDGVQATRLFLAKPLH